MGQSGTGGSESVQLSGLLAGADQRFYTEPAGHGEEPDAAEKPDAAEDFPGKSSGGD